MISTTVPERGKAKTKERLQKAAALLFWLLVWQVGAAAANRRLLIPIPTPLSTGAALLRLAGQAAFWRSVGLSLGRICLGFGAALLLGTVCGLASARFPFFRLLTAPLLQTIRAIPVASFTILVFLWVSRGKIPSLIAFFTVLPIIWANVESGALAADRSLKEMAAVFGMPRRRILTEITLPSLRPFFTSAVAGGLGFAWKSGVAAEVICRTADSIGSLLWAGKSSIDYDEVFALTAVIILLSTLMQRLGSRILSADRREKGERHG